MRNICIVFLLFPMILFAQENALPRVEVFYAMGLSRPLSLNKDISFQSGAVPEIGTRYNWKLKEDGYLKLGIAYSKEVYNMEGYFVSNNNKDLLFVTPDNVKVNSFTFSPVTFSIGFQKVYNKIKSIGVDFDVAYRNQSERRYKIGNTLLKENYQLNRKITLGVNGLFGMALPTRKPLRADLLLGYTFLSIASNTRFDPLQVGVRLSGGFGKW